MKKFSPLFVFASLVIFAGPALAESPLSLYGSLPSGRRGSVYLGCINCHKMDSDALSNQFGDYGGQFSETSVYYKFGDYGSQFSDVSACNPRAQNPPFVMDENGRFLGFLTLNTRLNGTVIPPRLLGACR